MGSVLLLTERLRRFHALRAVRSLLASLSQTTINQLIINSLYEEPKQYWQAALRYRKLPSINLLLILSTKNPNNTGNTIAHLACLILQKEEDLQAISLLPKAPKPLTIQVSLSKFL